MSPRADSSPLADLPPAAQGLMQRFQTRNATLAVVGMGYVGLPLTRAAFDAGFAVIGFDTDEDKVHKLERGENYLKHLGEDFTAPFVGSSKFVPTADESALGQADVVILCVPTPLGKHQEPDMTFVRRSTEMAARALRAGQLVSLESTSYPGTTRELCGGILAQAAKDRELVCGRDYFLVFAPEREDPGRKGASTRTIPRLVGGVDPASTAVGHALYSAIVQEVHAVESAEVAESAKLLENIYRSVNIALMNELKPVLATMGIDIWSVIKAASTKPFGFQAFYPGPGLGGHCIPIDPFYLSWKAREFGHVTRFIELAGEINHAMPGYVVDRTARALSDAGVATRGARILIIGLAYKPNIDDVRETPAAEVIKLLVERGATVQYHDPLVPEFPDMRRYNFDMTSVALTSQTLGNCDAIVIITDHDMVDYAMLGTHAKLIIDTRNAMARVKGPIAAKIVKA